MQWNRWTLLSMTSTAFAVAAAGCGGGQGGGSGAASQAHTIKSGNAVISYFGQPKPQATSSSSSVSVIGQAGATFTAVTLEPAPNLADTYITFGREISEGTAVEEVAYGGNPPTLLYQGDGNPEYPSISAYGTVAFQNNLALESIRPDGTGLRSISFSGIPFAEYPSYSVDGTNRLAFLGYSGGYKLCIGPGTGGTPTILQSSTNSLLISACPYAWNPAGTQVTFPAGVSGSGLADLYNSGTTAGTTPVDITPSNLQGSYNWTGPCWGPDGVTVLADASYGSSESLFTFNVNTGGALTLTPSGYNDGNGCFSPDGSKIAFYRGATGGATPGIYMCEADGENQQLVYPDSTGTSSYLGIAWSPFLPKETVVAASGSTFYHQAASGILLSQTGARFGSVLAFTAATPSAAAIQSAGSTGGSAPLEFTLTADSITSIGYINSYFSPGTTITLTSTPSVVVSIDATTGQVDLVAPLSVAKPSTVKNADGTLSYQGAFKGLYDGKGKNIAPNGASSVTVDPATGHVVRWA